MTMPRLFVSVLFATLLFAAAGSPTVLAQSTDSSTQTQKDEDVNLDTQLYLIIATNQDAKDGKTPAVLEGVMKQLRSSLPFENYYVSATLLNRVKNESHLSLKWIGGPFLSSGAATNQTPTFSEFRVNKIKLLREPNGQFVVRMTNFSFGARIPIVSGTAIAANGPAAPIINYDQTGLQTDISMREGEPVVVGTLNIGPSGDAIILVVSAKRTGR